MIALDRKGSNSLKVGMMAKTGATSLSMGGLSIKEAVGSIDAGRSPGGWLRSELLLLLLLLVLLSLLLSFGRLVLFDFLEVLGGFWDGSQWFAWFVNHANLLFFSFCRKVRWGRGSRTLGVYGWDGELGTCGRLWGFFCLLFFFFFTHRGQFIDTRARMKVSNTHARTRRIRVIRGPPAGQQLAAWTLLVGSFFFLTQGANSQRANLFTRARCCAGSMQ